MRLANVIKLSLFLFLAGILLVKNHVAAENSSDAIAIRVISNPQHYSALRWYKEQKFTGSPQSLTVDGYEAIRDGRTVYVNVGNVVEIPPQDGILSHGDRLYTNIYVVSYNQDAANSTVDIFGQMLQNLKFNSNLSGTGSCTNVSPEAVDCKDTVGCWHLQGDLSDSSGNSLHGVPGNDFKLDGTGKAVFNGINDYVKIGDDAKLKMNDSFTITASIYPIGPGSNMELETGDYGGIIINKEGEYEIARNNSGYIMYAISNPNLNGGSALWTWHTTNYRVPLFQWTHLAWIYGNNKMEIFANGKLVHSVAFAGSNAIGDSSLLWNEFRIGGRHESMSQYFHGNIAEVKVYNKVMPIETLISSYGNLACSNDDNCFKSGYCSNFKGMLARDMKRLSDLSDMNDALKRYKNANNGLCPKLSSGSYLPNKSLSVWPSWQETLAKELGQVLPIDPINRLGQCSPFAVENRKYNPATCWNETDQKFSTSTNPTFNLPNDSYSYIYMTTPDGRSCSIYGNMETGLICSPDGTCVINKDMTDPNQYSGADLTTEINATANRPPVISSINLPTGYVGKSFEGFVKASDPDGDAISWSIDTAPTVWSGWSSAPLLGNASDPNQKRIYAAAAGTVGEYGFTIVINDGKGGSATGTYNIRVIDKCDDKDADGYGVCPFCGTANGCTYDGNDCDDGPGNHSVYSSSLNYNTTVDSNKIHPGQNDSCEGHLGIDDNCNGTVDEDMIVSNVPLGGVLQDMETIDPVTGYPVGMSDPYAQVKTSISISTAENHTIGGSRSLLIHQDPNVLGMKCSEAMCNFQTALGWHPCDYIGGRCYYQHKDPGHAGTHNFATPDKFINGIQYYSDYDEGQNIVFPNTQNGSFFLFSYNISNVPFVVGENYFLIYFYKGFSNLSLRHHSGIVYNLPDQTYAQSNDYYRPCGAPSVSSYWGAFSGYQNPDYVNASNNHCYNYCSATSTIGGITYCDVVNSVDGYSLASKNPECVCYLQRYNPFLTPIQQATPYAYKRFTNLTPFSNNTSWSLYQDRLEWTEGMNSTFDYNGIRTTSIFLQSGYNDTGTGTDMYIDDINFIKCTNN